MRADDALRQHEACGCLKLHPLYAELCLTCWHALTSASRLDWTPSTDVHGKVWIPRSMYFRLRGAVKEAAKVLPPAAAPGPINLRDWQESLGVTGQQVADDLGVTRQSWSRWKNGQVPEPPWLPLALEALAKRYQRKARRKRVSCLLITLLLLSTGCAHTLQPDPPGRWETLAPTTPGRMATVATAIPDVLTTQNALARGGVEGNPVFTVPCGDTPGAACLTAVKAAWYVGISTLEYELAKSIGRELKWWESLLFHAAPVAFQVLASWHNSGVNR